MSRAAEVIRNTKETRVRVRIELDGTGKYCVNTGIGFFDHLLEGFARHGLFDLELETDGDLEVDCHHTIEDTGIVLGQAIREAKLEFAPEMLLAKYTALEASDA